VTVQMTASLPEGLIRRGVDAPRDFQRSGAGVNLPTVGLPRPAGVEVWTHSAVGERFGGVSGISSGSHAAA